MVQESHRNDQPPEVDESLSRGTRSVFQSFPSGSSSDVYQPNQENLVANLTWNDPSAEQNFSMNPLITLLREQAAEIENLKLIKSDLTAANASLRTQVENDTKSESIQLRNVKDVLADMATTSKDLRTQINDQKNKCQEKVELIAVLEKSKNALLQESAELRADLRVVERSRLEARR